MKMHMVICAEIEGAFFLWLSRNTWQRISIGYLEVRVTHRPELFSVSTVKAFETTISKYLTTVSMIGVISCLMKDGNSIHFFFLSTNNTYTKVSSVVGAEKTPSPIPSNEFMLVVTMDEC
jgi:hypothetical protein